MSPAASQIRAIRMCNGGESVDNGNAQTMCSYCSGGVCVQWQACEVPEPDDSDECPTCGGTGLSEEDGFPCEDCAGTGHEEI
jgi:DnaJ-class molecular chaperone